MKKLMFLGILAVCLTLASNAGAALVILNFDEFGQPRGDLPSNYAGLTWEGNWEHTSDYPLIYPRSSPPIGIVGDVGPFTIQFGQE